jgi:hypothetical protein
MPPNPRRSKFNLRIDAEIKPVFSAPGKRLTIGALQQYCCNMIPSLIALAGAPWKVLPPGIHPATLSEVEATFAINQPRRDLFAGFKVGAASLFSAGCLTLFLDGSYVTAKPIPGDYDACWHPAGVDPAKLDPVFRDFSNLRQAQKAKFGGEYFPSTMGNTPSQPFLDFFQNERFTGGRKGIVSIDLNTDPTLTRRTTP